MSESYDVAIVGSGFGGSALAAILAANGVSTVIIESQTHPRFAIGESLVPETSLRIKLLAERYNVPELARLASFSELRDHVSPACGVKRSFAFAYHREGEQHRGHESNQLPTLTAPFGPDAHLLRQDTDQWLLVVAAKYGADVHQNTKVEHVEFQEKGATVCTADGRRIEAAFVVDGTGVRSVLARQLELRDETPRFKTNSRGMFTQMVNVPPYDRFAPSRKSHGMPVPFGQSTLHHCFDGGWIWVIPFDNHRESTSGLCSVGLVLDTRLFPAGALDAESEFREVIRRFPSVARQFENAIATRPWVAAPRLQHSSSKVSGERYCLLPHAAGFVDPLYSSGLSITVAAIDLMARRLIESRASPEQYSQPLDDVEQLVQRSLDHYDVIVCKSFDSWRHYETWNAWNRVWALGNYLGTWGPLRLLVKWKQTRDRNFLDALNTPEQTGLLGRQHTEFMEVRDRGAEDLEAVLSEEISPKECADRIFARIDALDFIPRHIRFGQEAAGRAPTVFTLQSGARHVLWYQWFAPKKWRQYCSFSLFTYGRLVLGYVGRGFLKAFGRVRRDIRDIVFTWNSDWEIGPEAQSTNQISEAANDGSSSHSHSPTLSKTHRRREGSTG